MTRPTTSLLGGVSDQNTKHGRLKDHFNLRVKTLSFGTLTPNISVTKQCFLLSFPHSAWLGYHPHWGEHIKLKHGCFQASASQTHTRPMRDVWLVSTWLLCQWHQVEASFVIISAPGSFGGIQIQPHTQVMVNQLDLVVVDKMAVATDVAASNNSNNNCDPPLDIGALGTVRCVSSRSQEQHLRPLSRRVCF